MDAQLWLAVGPLAAAVVAFVAFCLIDLARSSQAAHLPRWAWALIILVSIPAGGIVYLLVGRQEGARFSASPEARQAVAPDDAEPDIGERQGTDRSPSPATAPRLAALAVATRGLSKRYGEVVALDTVDLAVPAGSVYGLVGPNGSGKTTLIGVLAGLRRATAGVVDLDVAPSQIGVLPDMPQFDPWLTAEEVCQLGARLATGRDPDQAAVRKALGEAGLAEAADRRCGGFSRGMLQRLGLASLLVGGPKLLLLDEPASALDPAGRKEILELIAALRGEATVLLSSHILADVERVADTVGILRAGRLLSQGSLEELLVGRASPVFVVRLRTDPEPVAAALAAAPWVDSATAVAPDRVEIGVVDVARAERALPEALAAAGAAVRELSRKAPDLEQVFLELTAGRGQGQAR